MTIASPSPVLVREAAEVPVATRGRVVVIGNMDGVHRGHQVVLDRARALSTLEGRGGRGSEVAVLTFEPHPAAALGRVPPAVLTRLSRKVSLLGNHGVSLVLAQAFDRAFASLGAEAFVDEILVRALGASYVVVGEGFRFGAGRAGDLALLRAQAARNDFEVVVQDLVVDANGPLSSTRVRSAVGLGDMQRAHELLGRPHAIEGVVVSGDRRGRTIGFPTANLAQIQEALPAHGVYAVVCDRAQQVSTPSSHSSQLASPFAAFARGVANFGVRPTVADKNAPATVEVHLFDLPADERDLYGQVLRVHLVDRIRPEAHFSSLDALRAQIEADAARARQITDALPMPRSSGWWDSSRENED